jgi:GNAT superfamily N-acetyltransferase
MALAERERVLSLLRSAHPNDPRQGNADFWNWHFLAHPEAAPDKIPVWVARAGERIAGQLATIPVRLRLAGETVSAVWILDLLVDPEFRRRGIMKRLVHEAQKEYPFMLGTATRRQHSAAMLTGLGWTVFSPIPRYHKILFAGNAVREIARLGPLRGIANALSAPLRLGLADAGRLSVREIDAADASFAELYASACTQWGCSVERTSAYLTWIFENQPHKHYRFLACYSDGCLVGYAVLYFRAASPTDVIDKAAISDICYHPVEPAKTIDALLAASLRKAIELRVGGLVTDALDPLLEQRLRAFGFRAVTSGQEIMATGPRHREVLFDPTKWHFTRGDSDISIFEQTNV